MSPARVFALGAALAAMAPLAAMAAQVVPVAPPPVAVVPPAPAGTPAPAVPVAVPVDPERLAIATEVIDAGFPLADREQTFFGAIDALLVQMRTVQLAQIQNEPGAATIINRKLDGFIAQGKVVLRAHIPALMEAMARAYAREFTRDELVDLRVFARTPAGRHFFLRSSSILRDPDFAAANMAYARELQPSIARMREELTAELKAYFVEHPPKPGSNS